MVRAIITLIVPVGVIPVCYWGWLPPGLERRRFLQPRKGNRLSAKIVALSEPTTAEGKEKTDFYNPDPNKRNHPIFGLIFKSGFTKKSDSHWENGTVYDPKSGKTLFLFYGPAGTG